MNTLVHVSNAQLHNNLLRRLRDIAPRQDSSCFNDICDDQI